MYRRRNHRMKYPKGINLCFIEVTYFYLICLLTQFIKCALSEDFWISIPTVKHKNVIGSFKQLHFVMMKTGSQGGWDVHNQAASWKHTALCWHLVRGCWLAVWWHAFLLLHLPAQWLAPPCTILGHLTWGPGSLLWFSFCPATRSTRFPSLIWF